MENRSYSSIYRIVHWAIAVLFTLLLVTIFLRLTWMNKYNVATIIVDQFANTEQHVSEDQAIALAKKIREPMWDWHIYLGYALVGLFAIRSILPAFGQMKFQNPMQKALSTKAKFRVDVFLLLWLVVLSLISGMLLSMDLGVKDRWSRSTNLALLLSGIHCCAFVVVGVG